jgi:hypothetical protein
MLASSPLVTLSIQELLVLLMIGLRAYYSPQNHCYQAVGG